jgi:hypothetical protein
MGKMHTRLPLVIRNGILAVATMAGVAASVPLDNQTSVRRETSTTAMRSYLY